MDENYCALALSIFKNYTPEQAFEILSGKEITKKFKKTESEEMFRLKQQGLTYREIGEIFNVSKDVVYTRVRRFTGKIK